MASCRAPRLRRPALLENTKAVAVQRDDALALQDCESFAHHRHRHFNSGVILRAFLQLLQRDGLCRHGDEAILEDLSELLRVAAVCGRAARRDQVHVDGASDGVHGSRLHRDLHQPIRLNHILWLDDGREPHARVRLGETDQALQLARRGRDDLLVVRQVAHREVGFDERPAGPIGDLGIDLQPRVRDVIHEGALVDGRSGRLAVQPVQRYEVLSQHLVCRLVDLIEHQIDEVEP
mmetsp:Transcript_33263/g.106119  ORF Transcript_33263/g.106119 Transcript_33263/m.106119 type:complete len:235 (+) Transcript_33263:160-864(+)|eukprot:scaffold10082_cov115-Isochrysis_galbana.AAC.7